ncbi:hypothetical protein Dred_0965 [Desulforamulus reducens MI-1]|uniref:Lipoprotein n=1 Tax=Desulforamulus reducens (strain ATCC BAA-1160 / DSM 100696 / MI-1) TaxID=349161 RepID=A4J347_DESRM|nr:hypothetical protein [Desulforamulus reducens]ABO49500.1 hypothetical protein Dred_0965 [Desulforamulus reducens MI-1]
MAELKRLIILLVIAALFTGCNKESNQDVVGVVNKYIEYSSALQWEQTEQLLTGEALLETRVNKDKVKIPERVLSKKEEVNYLTNEVATVTLDTTKENDRITYKFYLKKVQDNWLIFKVEYGDYLHDSLKPGHLPKSVEAQLMTYIELSKTEKDKRNSQFLAGPLLRASMKQLTLRGAAAGGQSEAPIKEKVKEIKCLGLTKDYAMVEVLSEVTNGENDQGYTMTAIYHLIDVNGIWKICRLDVVKMMG